MTGSDHEDRFTSWVDHLEDTTPENLIVIRAVGAASAQLHVSADTAFAALRAEATASGDSLTDVAHDVLTGRRTLPTDHDHPD